MNEEFTKHYENVFVPPAVGDEGQALVHINMLIVLSIIIYTNQNYMLNKEV